MTLGTYYPEQRHMLPLTLIRRERLLPENAELRIETVNGARVSLTDVIARGAAPAPYTVLDAAAFFRLRRPELLANLLVVDIGDLVDRGQTLAERGRRRLYSPLVAKVVAIEYGRIILQEIAENIELEAGLNGVVVAINRERSVTIEAFGAVLQGVWGNNRRAIGVLKMEPAEGLGNIFTDAININMEYRNAIIVTRQPLRAASLRAIEAQGLSGVIAPSMETTLSEAALQSHVAVLLTEGFGAHRMPSTIYQFLEDLGGRQATLDAVLPTGDGRRPEAIVNVPLNTGHRPGAPLTNLSLQPGLPIRVIHADGSTAFGQVIGLPKTPVMLDNGLRVQCAQVELVTGERTFVPLANLEVLGR